MAKYNTKIISQPSYSADLAHFNICPIPKAEENERKFFTFFHIRWDKVGIEELADGHRGVRYKGKLLWRGRKKIQILPFLLNRPSIYITVCQNKYKKKIKN